MMPSRFTRTSTQVQVIPGDTVSIQNIWDHDGSENTNILNSFVLETSIKELGTSKFSSKYVVVINKVLNNIQIHSILRMDVSASCIRLENKTNHDDNSRDGSATSTWLLHLKWKHGRKNAVIPCARWAFVFYCPNISPTTNTATTIPLQRQHSIPSFRRHIWVKYWQVHHVSYFLKCFDEVFSYRIMLAPTSKVCLSL